MSAGVYSSSFASSLFVRATFAACFSIQLRFFSMKAAMSFSVQRSGALTMRCPSSAIYKPTVFRLLRISSAAILSFPCAIAFLLFVADSIIPQIGKIGKAAEQPPLRTADFSECEL